MIVKDAYFLEVTLNAGIREVILQEVEELKRCGKNEEADLLFNAADRQIGSVMRLRAKKEHCNYAELRELAEPYRKMNAEVVIKRGEIDIDDNDFFIKAVSDRTTIVERI